MSNLEDFYKNELEFDFYGFTANEVIDEGYVSQNITDSKFWCFINKEKLI